jgi:hypothetical protein
MRVVSDRADVAFAPSGKALFFGSFLSGQEKAMSPAAQRTERP